MACHANGRTLHTHTFIFAITFSYNVCTTHSVRFLMIFSLSLSFIETANIVIESSLLNSLSCIRNTLTRDTYIREPFVASSSATWSVISAKKKHKHQQQQQSNISIIWFYSISFLVPFDSLVFCPYLYLYIYFFIE